MIKTTGILFDGISSIPQKIEIEFNENNGSLSFDIPISQSNFCAIEDLTIEHIGKSYHIHPEKSSLQFIKIEDEDFIHALNIYRKNNGHISWYHKMINLGTAIHITIALSILGIIVMVYLFLIPWIAEKAVVLIPQEYDSKMGETFIHEFVKYNTVDSAKTKELNNFAQQLELKNTKELKFIVVNSDIINAFALPDGTIVVFTGIIDQMKNYDELVGLIGHEVIHINNRHSMKMMCRNLSGYLFISAILSDVNGIIAIIGDNINSLNSLSYSRAFEKQADIEGLNLMIINNVNPQGMITLFKKLQSNNDNVMPEFLSSHPITHERLDYIGKSIKSIDYQIIDNQKLKDIFAEIKK